MSHDNKKRSDEEFSGNWKHLGEDSAHSQSQTQGSRKPKNKDLEEVAQGLIDFLQNSKAKRVITDLLIQSYKKFENKKLSQIRKRMKHRSKVDRLGATETHQPGNLEPLLLEDFNMAEVENAFARGLRQTKASLVRTVDDHIEEIHRLLTNIGGFSAQLQSSFARSTVVFLEQEDPKFSFRERLIFSINLPNYELKYPWDRAGNGVENVTKSFAKYSSKGNGNRDSGGNSGEQKKRAFRDPGGRTPLQATWDEAVNSLVKIVESTGLKPKYCKNDRNYGKFVMKQDLRSTTNIPDEYFSFTLDYNTKEKIKEMCIPYDRTVEKYSDKIEKLEKKLNQYPENSKSSRYLKLKKQHLYLCQERDFFVGTTPDPNQLDEGLLFLIEVSTLKDYHIVKDRMQSIMTRYILFLSKIAEKDAREDIDLILQLAKVEEISDGDQDASSFDSVAPADPAQKHKKAA